MSYGTEIAAGYAAVCTARDGKEAAKRFIDYRHAMLDLPPLEDGQVLEAVDPSSRLTTIDELWGSCSAIRYEGCETNSAYFRGSGLVGVGCVRDAMILAMSPGYKNGTVDDLVEAKYPNYRNWVPIFLGVGAMLGVMGVAEGPQGNAAYQRYSEVLQNSGIIEGGEAPHLGNSHRLIAGGVDTLTAGASGVLPQGELARYFTQRMFEELEEDRSNGLFEWYGDAQAGFHDVVANNQALALALGIGLPTIDVTVCIHEAGSRRLAGQNIH